MVVEEHQLRNYLALNRWKNTASGKTESWDGAHGQKQTNRSTDAYAVGASGAGNQNSAIMGGEIPPRILQSTEEFLFPTSNSSILTEGDLFLSGGTTLKGFGKAAGIPAATWSSGGPH